MTEYKPSTIVVKLAEKLGRKPIAEAIRLDGTVVIVFENGQKMIFDKDAITRTLTEPALATPEIGQGGLDLLSKSPPLTTPATRVADDQELLEDAGVLKEEQPHKRKKKGA